METMQPSTPQLRVGMVGVGMIFEETYAPFFEQTAREPLYDSTTGPVQVHLTALVSRTGQRAARYLERQASLFTTCRNLSGSDALQALIQMPVDVVCIATPDHRHFEPARAALAAGKHVLIEKPSVLNLNELDELVQLARQQGVLAKVVYHKLLDPDHKRLRTLVHDGVLRHVNNGYCSLLEPKSISGSQFAEWITGRNPATYVAIHYWKLIDFTFGPNWFLDRITATGQRGLVGPADGPTWDSVQMQVVYRYPDQREAAFDIHTSWVNPDNFPGYVEQEVQFRFDNGVWNAHQRKRGVEVTIEGRTPGEYKTTPNHHYNAEFLEPWGQRRRRGYGIEVIERFFREVAYVEYGGPRHERPQRLRAMQQLEYNDLAADRRCVAIVQALEAILEHGAQGRSGCLVRVNGPMGGLVLYEPGRPEATILYGPTV
ncbi:MAG: Gfo/Idh/MocA family oxidoreductase [Thermogemmata sp.]|nr:Gfo/Idh/MocA family oxidoreductase [Thermogemmata sp.]